MSRTNFLTASVRSVSSRETSIACIPSGRRRVMGGSATPSTPSTRSSSALSIPWCSVPVVVCGDGVGLVAGERPLDGGVQGAARVAHRRDDVFGALDEWQLGRDQVDPLGAEPL